MNRIALALAAIAIGTSVVSAQPYFGGARDYAPDPYDGAYPYRGVYPNPYYRGRAFGAPAAYCQKLCIQDFSPCDPPEYKQADGRCTNPLYRR